MTKLVTISSDVVRAVGEWFGRFAEHNPRIAVTFTLVFLGLLLVSVVVVALSWGPDAVADTFERRGMGVSIDEVRDAVREEVSDLRGDLADLAQRVAALEESGD